MFVDCKTYNTDKFYLGLSETKTQQSNVPYLDVSAAYKDGVLVHCVVNRNKDESITTDILSQSGPFMGKCSIYEVNGPDIKAQNDFEKTAVKTVEKQALNVNGNKLVYSFPPHSFTLLKVGLKK